jgi:hypothetical protein
MPNLIELVDARLRIELSNTYAEIKREETAEKIKNVRENMSDTKTRVLIRRNRRWCQNRNEVHI